MRIYPRPESFVVVYLPAKLGITPTPDFQAIMIKLMLSITSTPNDMQQQEIYLGFKC